MTFGERLIKARESIGFNQKQLAEKLGITPTRLNYWEKNKRQPDVEMIKKLSDVLHVSTDVLIGTNLTAQHKQFTENEINHIKKYRSLDDHGKKIVDLVLNEELERATEIIREDLNPKYKPALYSTQKFSAGTGTYLGVDDFETILIQDNEATKKVKFCGSVQGDSMEPLYHDGDILMVSNEPVEIGDIGIFTLDGNGYVKKRGINDLISLNPDYDPIPMDDTIKCNGKVIGILNPEWIKDN